MRLIKELYNGQRSITHHARSTGSAIQGNSGSKTGHAKDAARDDGRGSVVECRPSPVGRPPGNQGNYRSNLQRSGPWRSPGSEAGCKGVGSEIWGQVINRKDPHWDYTPAFPFNQRYAVASRRAGGFNHGTARSPHLFDSATAGLGGSGMGGATWRCSMVFSWLSQNASKSSVSGRRFNVVLTVHGLRYALGSSIVMASCIWPTSVRRKRSVTCRASVCGWAFLVSSQPPSRNPVVSTTKVSPSQRPTEYPSQVGSVDAGSGRPSVNTCRKIIPTKVSYRNAVSPGV